MFCMKFNKKIARDLSFWSCLFFTSFIICHLRSYFCFSFHFNKIRIVRMTYMFFFRGKFGAPPTNLCTRKNLLASNYNEFKRFFFQFILVGTRWFRIFLLLLLFFWCVRNGIVQTGKYIDRKNEYIHRQVKHNHTYTSHLAKQSTKSKAGRTHTHNALKRRTLHAASVSPSWRDTAHYSYVQVHAWLVLYLSIYTSIDGRTEGLLLLLLSFVRFALLLFFFFFLRSRRTSTWYKSCGKRDRTKMCANQAHAIISRFR